MALDFFFVVSWCYVPIVLGKIIMMLICHHGCGPIVSGGVLVVFEANCGPYIFRPHVVLAVKSVSNSTFGNSLSVGCHGVLLSSKKWSCGLFVNFMCWL